MEIWKSIPGYNYAYQASTKGRIKSVERIDPIGRHIKQRIFIPQKTADGYHHVCLCVNGKAKTFRVHRLVAMTFIENTNDYSQVNHINHNKTDNCVENLEWVTPRENSSFRNTKKTSKYIGVSRLPSGKWTSSATINNKLVRGGNFVSEEDARDNYLETLKKENITNRYANVP